MADDLVTTTRDKGTVNKEPNATKAPAPAPAPAPAKNFVVTAKNTNGGKGVLEIQKDGKQKQVRVRFYSPDLAYYNEPKKDEES